MPLNAVKRCDKNGTISEIKLPDMLLAAALTLGMFAVVKPLTDRSHIKWCRKEISATDYYTVSFIALPVVSAVPHHFSINIMYSAFLAGYVAKSISANDKTALDRMEAVKNFSFTFFSDIFCSGRNTVKSDKSFLDNEICAFLCHSFRLRSDRNNSHDMVYQAEKKRGREFCGNNERKGQTGYSFAPVAYSYKIISIEFFTVLILTTMLSSMIAGYWLRYQQKKDSAVFAELYET